MKFSYLEMAQALGALCFFIFGMKMMSEGIQRAAGDSMRSILKNMTKNRFLGIFTGFLITALVQSSSATTVMTVSFVNAGLLSLTESAGVLMGANIGTTITAWIISLLGFKVSIGAYCVPLFAIGVPMIFSSKSRVSSWGEFIIGFGILMLGLETLKSSVEALKDNVDLLEALKNYSNGGILTRIFFVLIGTLVTVLVQSSSAAMAITLTMCSQGWIPFEIAASMVLGENIGTTITAQLAALVGNVNAKRSARIHAFFNIIGVIWMVTILPVFLPFLLRFMGGFVLGYNSIFGTSFKVGNPFVDAAAIPIALSAFHTLFNVINVLVLVWFTKYVVRLAKWSVKGKDEDDDVRIKFLNSVILSPELAVDSLHRETAHFGTIVGRMNGFTKNLINATEEKKKAKFYKKINKYEKITDEIEIEITEYITKLFDKQLTPLTSVIFRSMLNICNDLERIGDLYYQVSLIIEDKNDKKIWFDQEQRDNINLMIDKVDEAFKEMTINLNKEYTSVNIDKARSIEEEINELRNQLRTENTDKLGNKDYNVKSALVYNNLFSSLERIGDHIINVTESVVGEI